MAQSFESKLFRKVRFRRPKTAPQPKFFNENLPSLSDLPPLAAFVVSKNVCRIDEKEFDWPRRSVSCAPRAFVQAILFSRRLIENSPWCAPPLLHGFEPRPSLQKYCRAQIAHFTPLRLPLAWSLSRWSKAFPSIQVPSYTVPFSRSSFSSDKEAPAIPMNTDNIYLSPFWNIFLSLITKSLVDFELLFLSPFFSLSFSSFLGAFLMR